LWTIQTDSREHLERIVQITITAFDAKLHETPVNAFALNYDYHRRTHRADVAAASPNSSTVSRLARAEHFEQTRLAFIGARAHTVSMYAWSRL